MKIVKKFKSDIGEDIYNQKIKDFAINKDVRGAIKICDTCSELEFDHKPGPCTRSTEIKKYQSEELNAIISAINNDIVTEIVNLTKLDIESSKSDPTHKDDKLACALEKIAQVIGQQQQVTPQVTKVKPPPTWVKESFSDYKIEVEAWEKAHPGEIFSKYSELINELKKNKIKPGLSDYASTIIIEKIREIKTFKSILEALEEKYELTRKEKFNNLLNMIKFFRPGKTDTGEQIFSKIEKIEAAFRNLAVSSNSNYFLATLLLKDLSESEIVNEIEQRCIEDLIEKKDDISIMSEFKKWFKRIKIESKRDVVKSDGDNEIENKTTYFVRNNERSRYGSWKNSRDFKDFSRTNSNNWRTKSENRWRKSES